MRPPRITVAIPLFNKSLYIRRAVESVLNQSFHDFEIVIVDDGSTDGGAGIARSMTDPRIRLIQQPNKGVSSARNRGIKEARSELIAFLDADDAWEPLFLETILRLREAFPHVGAYATTYRMITPDGQEHVSDYCGIPAAPWEGIVPDYFATAIRAPLISSSTVAVPKDVFSVVGLFPESEAMGEDLEMWLRIALKYPIAFSRYIGGTWFLDRASGICNTVATPDDPLILSTIQRALRDGTVDPKLSVHLREYHDALAARFAKQCLLEGRPNTARHLLRRCFERRKGASILRLLALLPDRSIKPIFAIRRRLISMLPTVGNPI